jgi:hypothetical protein
MLAIPGRSSVNWYDMAHENRRRWIGNLNTPEARRGYSRPLVSTHLRQPLEPVPNLDCSLTMAQQATPASPSSASIDYKHDDSLDSKHTLPPSAGGEVPGTTSSSFDGDHVFEDQKLGKYFVPIPEYEGMHR